MYNIKTNATAVARALERAGKQTSMRLGEQVAELTELVYGYAVAVAPVDTGALKDNITFEVTSSGNSHLGTITSNPIGELPYNVWQEYGSTKFNVPYRPQYYMYGTQVYLNKLLRQKVWDIRPLGDWK